MTGEPRLRYHLQPHGALWYLNQAESNHVLVDPQAEARALAPGFVRPVELWRAPRWQRPSSAALVRYHEDGAPHGDGAPDEDGKEPGAGLISDVPPSVGEVVNRSSVVDFVSDVSAFRLGALGALVDAVAAALDGGPPVVLAAPDADQGALWIGAVSFFAAPATTLRLSFSTHERLADVIAGAPPVSIEPAGGRDPAASPPPGPEGDVPPTRAEGRANGPAGEDGGEDGGRRTPVLSVVPEADVDRLDRRLDLPFVLVDPRVEAGLVAFDGVEHRVNHLGQRIRVTDWSRLVLDVCCEDYPTLERCLTRLDELGLDGGPPGERGTWWPAAGPRLTEAAGPAWPLAAAVALTGGLPLALPTATRVLLRDTPGTAPLPEQLASVVTELFADTMDDAEHAWARLRQALGEPVRPTLLTAALESYLRLALAEDSWLLRGAPPLPERLDHAPPDPGLPFRLRAPMTALVRRLSEPTSEPASGPVDHPADVLAGVLLLRAVDFLHRLARLLGGPDLRQVGLGLLAERAACLLQDGDTGARIAEIAGPLDGEALSRWVVPALARPGQPWLGSSQPVGRRLPAAVLALLAPAVQAVQAGRADGADGNERPGEVALEVAVASATGRIAGDPGLRGPAVEHLLRQAAESYPDADPGPIVAEIFDRVADCTDWAADDLLRLVRTAPPSYGAELVGVLLRLLPDWIDAPQGGRLAAELLKRIEFLPRLGGDGRPRPRRGDTSEAQAQLLNLLAATGPGWLRTDDGLHRRAAEVLMWGDRAWAELDTQVRRLIAPRLAVAAFQVALAAEPAQSGTALRARLGVVPVGPTWRSAVAIGLEPALPMIAQVLRLNRYRLAGELVVASTRAMLEPVEHEGDLPRLPMLPVGPMIRWLVGNESEPRLSEHLSALVTQELTGYEGTVDRPGLVSFWERALPPTPLTADDARLRPGEPILTEAWHVALFGRTEPAQGAGLATLLAPARRPLPAPDRNGPASRPGAGSRNGPARERLASREAGDQELPDDSGTADSGSAGPVANGRRGFRRPAPIRPPAERRPWWKWWAG